jgi:AbrB family looped-hinge helix DNA binding protein
MGNNITVKVSNRYQISLPSVARKRLNIQAGDRLLVDIQEGLIVLTPQPSNYVKHLAGLHKDVWQDVDTTEYLEKERAEW